ncbi:hypothetical protein CAPTEDRAFT_118680 [Capitella teleta]|uniref:L-Fucosyltransferase n=1 Tax=Capitella teleta TaxID=283909 RepID=R7T611_CAPTE|nr:hypothetical protein CAPTEDRAFT_118680 [Capitella teleta]|eukprot:ELT88678.1 hypothetical protein CAPTEDRAFT_118680 [Capitella teleta]
MNIELSGYYHSFKYFTEIEDDIRREFTFKESIQNKVNQFIQKSMVGYENYTKVGIHVRRGDFLREDAQKFGDAVATPEYMEKSMKFFQEKFPRVWFFAAGNGGDWTKENVKADHVAFSEDFSPFEDLALLSSCDHTIATVGTFSWWAAWLTNGITTYFEGFPVPNTRLGNRYIKEDYIPPNWIAMK